VIKRSLTLCGHKTSLALESEFWLAIEKIATNQSLSVPAMIAKIDASRQNNNLSSAVRLYVLKNIANT
jgi:predicted DNA-binding ribbon-helix-helix protein